MHHYTFFRKLIETYLARERAVKALTKAQGEFEHAWKEVRNDCDAAKGMIVTYEKTAYHVQWQEGDPDNPKVTEVQLIYSVPRDEDAQD